MSGLNIAMERLYKKYLAFTSVICIHGNRSIMTTSALKHLENTKRIAGFSSEVKF